jgi:hypothetical protein
MNIDRTPLLTEASISKSAEVLGKNPLGKKAIQKAALNDCADTAKLDIMICLRNT